jgi:hypothetical protein
MANMRTLPVLEDTGSEQLKKLTDAHNALVDLVGDILDDLEGAADDAARIAAATARLALVEADTSPVVKIGRLPGVVVRPSRAVTS